MIVMLSPIKYDINRKIWLHYHILFILDCDDLVRYKNRNCWKHYKVVFKKKNSLIRVTNLKHSHDCEIKENTCK